MSWSDEPIKGAVHDSLGRQRVADMIVSEIEGIQLRQASTVFGIVGEWGSGKSSLINLCIEQLGSDWKVARFSPWAASDMGSMSSEFLATLSSVATGRSAKVRRMRKAVLRYARIGTPFLGAIPAVGSAVADFSSVGLSAVDEASPWFKEFEQISARFADLGYRVLILVDDIDRLDPDELLNLLKVIRLLGRFPNVHYLLAYDQLTINALLSSRGIPAAGPSFMEKIVQYQFEIPPIGKLDGRRRIVDSMQHVCTKNRIAIDVAGHERASMLVGTLTSLGWTPRTHYRFFEQVRLALHLTGAQEIDFLDLVATTYLRVYEPSLYAVIPEHLSLLQSGSIWKPGLASKAETIDPSAWSKHLGLVSEPARETFEVMSFLFPGVLTATGSFYRDHDRALSSPEYFERYLTLSLPTGDFRDEVINRAIREISQGYTASNDFSLFRDAIDSPDNDLASLVLEKAYRMRAPKHENSGQFAQFLVDRLAARKGEVATFDQAVSVLWRWLTREIYLAQIRGELDLQQILAAFDEDDLVTLLLRVRGDISLDITQRDRFLDIFADHFVHLLQQGFVGVLEKPGRLASIAGFIDYVGSGKSIGGIADKFLVDSSPVSKAIFIEFARVGTWPGGAESRFELEFDDKLYALLVSQDARSLLEESLEPEADLSQIVRDDVTPDNRYAFSVAWISSKRARPDARRQ